MLILDPIPQWNQLWDILKYVIEIILIPLLVRASNRFTKMEEAIRDMSNSLYGLKDKGIIGIVERVSTIEKQLIDIFKHVPEADRRNKDS